MFKFERYVAFWIPLWEAAKLKQIFVSVIPFVETGYLLTLRILTACLMSISGNAIFLLLDFSVSHFREITYIKINLKHVNVDEPVCRINQQRVYGAERNEEINITCQVDGNPLPNWFRWSFNNSMVHIVSIDNFVNSNGSSVITYKPTTETHYGTLLCSSQNELGPQVVPCVFHIVSAGKCLCSVFSGQNYFLSTKLTKIPVRRYFTHVLFIPNRIP